MNGVVEKGVHFIEGKLVRRYRRFLAEVELNEKETTVIAHCPNTGSMMGCCEPGRPVWLSISRNPLRKYPYTWEFIDMPASLVGINTHLANKLVKEALALGKIEGLAGYDEIKSEVKIGPLSRLDLRLSGKNMPDCYVEVKNCTLVDGGTALFPDAVTLRGQRHLLELSRLAASGLRAVVLIVVQRMDATCFSPADQIDPAYGRLLREALTKGVELKVYDAVVRPFDVHLRGPLEVRV